MRLTGPVSRGTAQVVADKIFNQVALPIYPDDGADELSVTKSADDAMYANKRDSRHATGSITNP